MKDRGKWLEFTLVSILTTLCTTSGIVASLQAIFFPHEAESKGANPFEYGLIFAIYELAYLIATPVLGSYIHLVHRKTTILLGILLCGSTTILFGLTTDKLESTWVFLLWCSVLRIGEAIGASAIFMGSLVFIATEFPHSIAMYSGVLDTGFQIGSGIGPSIGAPLFQLGGFEMPFLCVGGFLVVSMLLPILLISRGEKSNGSAEPGEGCGFFGLLQIPPVLFYVFNTMMVDVGVMFLSSMLEPHIRKFELTKSEVGLMFFAMEGVYGLTCPIFGWMADRMVRPGFLTLLGLVFITAAFLLIGPATFIPLKSNIACTALGLVLVGLGQGAMSVSSFIEMIHESERAGFTDEVSRSGLIIGLYVSASCLGGVIGPTLGGLLVTHFGFPIATDFFFIVYSILAIIMGQFLRHRVTQHMPLQNH